MITTLLYILYLIMIFGGLYATLAGFKIIKIKANSGDQRKVDEWHQKFGKLIKVCGIVMLVFGLFLLTTLILNPQY